jgi:hypothetical protein
MIVPLFKVAQVNRMRAKVWANEDEIAMIRKGMKAYTEIGGKRFQRNCIRYFNGY